MKSSLAIFCLLALVSCGRKTVHKTTVIENPFDNSGNEARLSDLEQRVTSLEGQHSALVSTISGLENSISSQSQELLDLEAELKAADSDIQDSISNQISSVQGSISSLQSSITSLQSQTNSIQTTITSLSTGDRIVEVIDPCGTTPNKYNEVILKLSSGKLVAYFEDSGKRFLTILKPGSFQTTDDTNCRFSVNANNQVIF